MKKHFLLVLMAFMSMTAWAQIDISSFAIRVSAGVYGGAAPVITVYDTEIGGGATLTQGTDFTWNEKFYSDAACNTEAGAFADLLPGGPYYVKVVGTGSYQGEKIGSCSIKKGQITGIAITIPGKTFGAVDPTPVVTTTSVTGFKSPDTWASVFGDATITYTLASQNVGTPLATFDALSTDLYEVVFPTDVTCTISKKPLTAEMVITPASGTSVYTAVAQVPSVVVKDGTKTLVAGADKDYTVKTYSNAALTSEADAIGVGTYYVGILGGGNYSSTSPIAAGSFEITQATLTAIAVDQEKNYNASAALPKTAWSATATETAMNIIGYLGTDGPSAISTKPTASIDGTASADAGTYTIKLSGGASTNYKFNYVPGTFTIKKLPLAITANDNSKLFGDADPVFTNPAATPSPIWGYTMTGFLAAEENDIRAWIDHTNATTEAATKANGDIKVTRSNATVNDKGVYEGVLVVSYNNTANSVLRNYNVTTTAGKFTIAGGQIYITVLPQTIEYGDDEPNWASPEAGKDYIVTGLSGEDKLQTAPTLTRATPTVKNVGTYAVTADGAVAPAGYAGITYVPSTLTIAAKALIVTPQVQTLKLGQKVTALDQTLFTISETTKLATGDKASEIIELAFEAPSITGAPSVNTSGELNYAGSYAKGIKAIVKTGVTNYTIKTPVTYGKLIVVDPDATIVLNRPAKDDFADAQKNNAAAVIAAAAADKYTAAEAATYNAGLTGHVSAGDAAPADYNTKVGSAPADATNLTEAEANAYNAKLTGAVSTSTVQPKDVTFGDFEMAKDRWYSLVLPFDTDVKTVSEAFGYAVVDHFEKESNISNDVMFKLWMGELPANEPFILKIYQDTNLNTVTFNGVTVVASENPSVKDAAGNEFIGTYAGINGFEGGKQYIFSLSTGKIARAGASSSLRPLGAYIKTVEIMDGMSAAPRIVIEEPNGETTAIETINIEQQNQDAEGWYNLNGMKLNGAPSQKGVFIKNGKKVIVK